MSLLTNFLNLFKYQADDADRNETFNFDLGLNDNWDKVDAWATEVDAKLNGLGDGDVSEAIRQAVNTHDRDAAAHATAIGAHNSDAGAHSAAFAAHNTASDAHSTQFAGKAALGKAYTGTLSVTGWTGSGPYTQVVSIAGLKEPRLRPDFALITSGTKTTDLARWESWAYIQRVVAEDGKITVTCYEDKPTVALPFTLEVHD